MGGWSLVRTLHRRSLSLTRRRRRNRWGAVSASHPYQVTLQRVGRHPGRSSLIALYYRTEAIGNAIRSRRPSRSVTGGPDRSKHEPVRPLGDELKPATVAVALPDSRRWAFGMDWAGHVPLGQWPRRFIAARDDTDSYVCEHSGYDDGGRVWLPLAWRRYRVPLCSGRLQRSDDERDVSSAATDGFGQQNGYKSSTVDGPPRQN